MALYALLCWWAWCICYGAGYGRHMADTVAGLFGKDGTSSAPFIATSSARVPLAPSNAANIDLTSIQQRLRNMLEKARPPTGEVQSIVRSARRSVGFCNHMPWSSKARPVPKDVPYSVT